MRGFTLIELLVVIAIIGILMGIILASTSTIKRNSRDDQRQSDLATIRSALESYYSDRGYYPSGNSLAPLLNTGGVVYLKTIPTDPVAGNPQYAYRGLKNGSCNSNPSGAGCSCDDLTQATNCYAFDLCTAQENPPSGSVAYCGAGYNFQVTQPQ